MSTYHQAVSHKVEKIMSRQSPKAVDSTQVKGQRGNSVELNGVESAATLAKLTSAQALSVCIYFHQDQPQDRKDLHKYLLESVKRKDWFSKEEYLAKSKYRNRVDQLIYCVIDSFRANQVPTQTLIAGYMSMSVRTYSEKTNPWQQAHTDITDQLKWVFMDAVQKIHRNG